MTNLRSRLQTFFAETSTRRLARTAPAALLAGGAGIALGALIGSPAFAATGAGIVIGGIAINFTSSLLEKLVMLPLDAEDEREQMIEQGLEQQDLGIAKLIAATLVQTGPELAQALPTASKKELTDGLEKAMQAGGAPLQAIAKQYADALRGQHADWPALHAMLNQTISRVEQLMEATQGSEIKDSSQRFEGERGSQVMRATDRSRITGSSQTVISGRGSSTGSTPTNAGRTSDTQQGDRVHLEELLTIYTRRLQEREKQAALQGINTSPEVKIEIEDLNAAITRIRRRLGM